MVLHDNGDRRISNVTAPSDNVTDTGLVTLRYWASARAAAGVDTDPIDVTESATLADLIVRAKALHADSSRFADVISCCSVMVGDRPVTSEDPAAVRVPAGSTVEFLPPFAGG
jgi:molybdopterin synthase sulfur carrier subunit